jgi:hypothetical protein
MSLSDISKTYNTFLNNTAWNYSMKYVVFVSASAFTTHEIHKICTMIGITSSKSLIFIDPENSTFKTSSYESFLTDSTPNLQND